MPIRVNYFLILTIINEKLRIIRERLCITVRNFIANKQRFRGGDGARISVKSVLRIIGLKFVLIGNYKFMCNVSCFNDFYHTF